MVWRFEFLCDAVAVGLASELDPEGWVVVCVMKEPTTSKKSDSELSF